LLNFLVNSARPVGGLWSRKSHLPGYQAKPLFSHVFGGHRAVEPCGGIGELARVREPEGRVRGLPVGFLLHPHKVELKVVAFGHGSDPNLAHRLTQNRIIAAPRERVWLAYRGDPDNSDWGALDENTVSIERVSEDPEIREYVMDRSKGHRTSLMTVRTMTLAEEAPVHHASRITEVDGMSHPFGEEQVTTFELRDGTRSMRGGGVTRRQPEGPASRARRRRRAGPGSDA
jgi:hypothetical protein